MLDCKHSRKYWHRNNSNAMAIVNLAINKVNSSNLYYTGNKFIPQIEYHTLQIFHLLWNYAYLVHVYCNLYKIREQKTIKKTTPEISGPRDEGCRLKDVDFFLSWEAQLKFNSQRDPGRRFFSSPSSLRGPYSFQRKLLADPGQI